jgi:hypothetical protein
MRDDMLSGRSTISTAANAIGFLAKRMALALDYKTLTISAEQH